MRYLFLMLMSFAAIAGDYQRHNNTVVNNYYEETTEITYTGDSDVAGGVALAIATYHPFDYATKKWQGSINGATYDGQGAISMGMAKRFDDMDALFHTSYGQNNGKDALTFGALWRF